MRNFGFSFRVVSYNEGIPLVKADYDYGYLAAANFYTTNWLQSSGEAQDISGTFNYIDGLFQEQTTYLWVSYGGVYGSEPTYGKVMDWGYGMGGYSATSVLVHENIEEDNNEWYGNAQNTAPFSTTLYIGHGGVFNNIGTFYGYDGNQSGLNDPNDPPSNAVTSSDITAADPEVENFVFLWVCFNGAAGSNGNSPGPMANAWSGGQIQQCDIGTNLGWNPDSSGYCYISFYQSSPCLTDYLPSGDTCESWLQQFYELALYPG